MNFEVISTSQFLMKISNAFCDFLIIGRIVIERNHSISGGSHISLQIVGEGDDVITHDLPLKVAAKNVRIETLSNTH